MTVMSRNRIQIAIAPDSFKGTLTAPEAAACMARGVRRVLPNARLVIVPMADGGEGTVETVLAATGGRQIACRVHDPLGRAAGAFYGLTPDGTAVMEMAQASGLMLLAPRKRNPLKTSTRGTGDLIKSALDRGARRFLIGVGGSATNDGGAGMARALGICLLDSRGRQLPEGGGALERLARIDASGLDPRIGRARIDVACDVRNPMTGPEGASRVYGPQKGATPLMVRQLDRNLARLAEIMRRDLGVDIENLPGGGAAGGLAAGLVAFTGARLVPGVQTVVRITRLAERIRGSDLVITGEGRTDWQTCFGKVPIGVASVAVRLGIPVIILSGSVGPGAADVIARGVDAVLAVIESPVPESELRATAGTRLTRAAGQVARIYARGWLTKKGV